MNKFILLLIAICFIPLSVFAENETNYYYCFRSSFTAVNIDKLKSYGKNTDSQPFKRTSVNLNMGNPYYFHLAISTVTNVENTFIANVEANGRCVRYMTAWMENWEVFVKQIRKLPDDFYKSYSVIIST